MGKNFRKFLVMLVTLSMVFTMTAVPVYADDMQADQDVETVLMTEDAESYETEVIEETETPAPVEEPVSEIEPAVTDEPVAEEPAVETPAASTETETPVTEEAAVPQENVTPAEVEKTAENAEEVAAETVPVEVVAEETNAITEKVSKAIVKLAAVNEAEEEVAKIAYEGEEVNFIKADGSGFGMFAPQEGTTATIKGNNVVIHYVPKNTTTYAGFNWGTIKKAAYADGTAQPGIEVKANEDGSYDITLSKDYCGYAHPLAVVKKEWDSAKPTWTSKDQYYLAIPAADKLPEVEEEVAKFAYDGEKLNFIKEDGSGFGMFAPQDGTKAEIQGDNVVIHYVPKNTSTYAGFNWGTIKKAAYADGTAQPGIEVKANEDGSYDITLSKDYCGYAHPLAVVKKEWDSAKPTWTSKDQYYLAIPAADKLPEVEEEVAKFAYEGEEVNFIKEDGSGFGMFTPQEGTTATIKGNNVVIHYVPKNTTTYAGFNWGTIKKAAYVDGTAQPGIEVKANEDGSYDITLSKDYCGYAHPLAVVKKSFGKGSWTSADQYYLAIPAADKLPEVEEEVAKFAYDGEKLNFIKEDGSGFGMFAPQDGTKAEIQGDNVVIHYVPKNTSTYAGFNWGTIKKAAYADGTAQPGIEVKANEDGSYDITLSKDYCGYAHPLAVIKKSFGKGSWTSTDQYYLAIPANSAPDDPTPVDPTPVDPSEDDVVGADLTITNEATMFKVVSAKLVTENGKEYLVFVMNSSGYHEVFKGTKTQAVANGDGSKDKGNNTWIHGSVNSAGKWQFKLPLTKGESYVPITSISDRNYQTYLSGKGALADVFYGKQLKIDRTAKTLLVEDYNAADDKVTPDSEKPVPEEKTTPSDTNESSYAPAVDSSTTLPDGVYTPDSFSWSGGTGRLTISCTQITVKDGQAYATIVFSSDKVDQLKANGSIYYKEGSGLSTFTIPVNLNANNTIVGRTTAMSQPHWVEYTIYIGLAENEEQAEKAKEAKKDAAEAKTKLMDRAPAIVGLEAKEDQPEIEYSKNFKIFEYENDVKMISIDISEKTALDEEYAENAKKAAAASESGEEVQYDENGKAISKSKEEYTAELYKNKVVNYLLVPEDFEIPAGLDKEYIIVAVPSDKTFMASEEVISIMEELDCLDAITLLAMDEKDVKNDTLKKAIKDEKIKLAGNLEKPDYAKVVKDESTLAVLPGSVLPEEIDKNAKDKDKEKLEKEAKEKQEALEKIESRFAALAVPVVIDRSAQEEDELAQAEWVKVYGAFFGCEEEAEKIFEKKVKEAEKNGKN